MFSQNKLNSVTISFSKIKRIVVFEPATLVYEKEVLAQCREGTGNGEDLYIDTNSRISDL